MFDTWKYFDMIEASCHCGQTYNDCKGWTAEDIEDAINAGLVD